MLKIKHFIEQSWLLIVSSFIFGLLIAVTNAAWSPRIEQNKIAKINHLMTSLLPDAKKFDKVDQVKVLSSKGKELTSKVYKALSQQGQCIGWAFNAEGPGFADKIELIIAVDGSFRKFAGFAVLASNETPGFGSRIKEDFFSSQFKNAPAAKVVLVKTGDDEKIDSEIVAISGATVSSEAVVKIFNMYTEKIKNHLQEKGLISNDK